MDEIGRIAAEHGLAVVEDCAQAVLAEHDGRRVGSLGTVGCFSLHPLKTLNACGDGGVLTTDDDELAGALRMRRNIGLRTRDDCETWSGNSRLDTVQAALLLVKLDHVERWTEQRRGNARLYADALRDVPQIQIPHDRENDRAVYHTFVVQADRRDELRQHLKANGVETAVHYPVPIHLHTAARGLGYGPGDFPRAEEQAARIVSLPVYPELTPQDVDYVAESIRSFYAG
jgi:dTDP-4-amino-4,6-dideoxygalactose transaminase